MTHRRTFAAGMAFGAVLTSALFMGCSSLDHVSGQRFAETAAKPIGSMYNVRYIGSTGQRVYLEEQRMIPLLGWRTNVLWTDVTDLPPGTAEKLGAGINPPSIERPAEQKRATTQPADPLHL